MSNKFFMAIPLWKMDHVVNRSALGPEGRGASVFRLVRRSIYDRDECHLSILLVRKEYRT